MGALTNKPMAFNSRNWEYNSQITNDLTDFLTPRIRVDQFSGKIYRILPTVEWISNKIRFLYLGLKNQRVVTPLLNYKYDFTFNLSDRTISYSKKSILTVRFEKAFSLLKYRLTNNKKKNINLILGSLFETSLSFFDSFEKRNTRVTRYLELSGDANVTKFPDLANQANYIFFGVNPRMESPLLNLKIKDNHSNIYSLGNFSFSYPVKVISNNSSVLLEANLGKLASNSLALFGLSTISLSKNYQGNKSLLLPLYYHNNLVNYQNNSVKLNKKTKEDFNIYVSPQNLIESNEKSFSCIISSHFEKISGNEKAIRIPISSYLESSINYLNKDLKLEKISSIKPSYGISDFTFALMLYTVGLTTGISKNKLKGIVNKDLSFKVRLSNLLISNNVPSYLVRDPLGRANPLFNKI